MPSKVSFTWHYYEKVVHWQTSEIGLLFGAVLCVVLMILV
jgi:tetrahydromethanopterin S-methyltransferase subunit G